MPIFHDFPGLFYRVVIKQARLSYTFTKCSEGSDGVPKLPSRSGQSPANRRVLEYMGLKCGKYMVDFP